MAANPGLVTVFGASGFLGRYVVRSLVARGWRVRAAVRNPHTAHELKVIGDVGQVQLMQANLRFPNSVARAVEGADAVVNLVAVLFESGRQTFETLHVRPKVSQISRMCPRLEPMQKASVIIHVRRLKVKPPCSVTLRRQIFYVRRFCSVPKMSFSIALLG